MASYRSTSVKITLGYSLLLGILLFSLFFVYRESMALSASDSENELRTDSLMLLLQEKDRNTVQILELLNENIGLPMPVTEVEEVVLHAAPDTVVHQQRVLQRVITKRDTLITRPKKKRGFFKRLAEAFSSSSRQDTAVLVNISQEYVTDTILEPVVDTVRSAAIADSVHKKIELAKEQTRRIRRDTRQYRQLNRKLTARIDSLVNNYQKATLLRTQEKAEQEQALRQRSVWVISCIAAGAVSLSILFLIVIWRDIARSNQYRCELEEANRRAEGLLEAREKMMLAITHDFKAPLGSIMGYTDLLSRLTKDERQRFYLNNMKGSSEHLLRLVTDLLDFHRLDLNKAEITRVVFNPAQLFEEIRVSFEPMTSAKGIALRCEVDDVLDGCYISDPLRLRQIVNNLLSNAVKFTPEGSVTLRARYADWRITIAVQDTGKGMAPEDRERIFQEFTRLPGAQGEEGFGLGLSIVRKLIALLQGSIDVQSVPGEGSTFTVTLPLTPVDGKEAAADEAAPATAPAAPEGRKWRVLMIDDDRIQLTMTSVMLEQQGIEAVACEQTDELVEHLRHAAFDVLLTDVQMPAISGFDLLTLLRGSNIPQARSIPIVAVTARSDMDEAYFRGHGFAGCLHKPFNVRELVAVVTGMSPDRLAGASPASGEEKPDGLDFGALTAFSADDPEAAGNIIRTFMEETAKNEACLRQALEEQDAAAISALAHKLLPLFRLIGASQAVGLLERLEAMRGQDFTSEMDGLVRQVLPEVDQVVEQAGREIGV